MSVAGNTSSLSSGSDLEAIIGTAGQDTLFFNGGPFTLDGGDGNDSLGGSFFSDSRLIGGGGDDTASYAHANAGVAVTLDGSAGDDGDDLVRVVGAPGAGDTLSGGAGNDTLAYDQAGFYRLTNTDGVQFTAQFLGADSAEPVEATASFSGFESFTTRTGSFDLAGLGLGQDVLLQVCFAAGTRIATPRGEVAVEALAPGDLVLTADRATEMVLFVGRRHVVLAGRADAAAMAPIRILAGALGAGTPRRDLVLSPDHCLFLDGALVPARLLANGTTILAETHCAEVTWYHVELPRHAVILAEGAPAESWLDTGNRSWFANASVALLEVEGNLAQPETGWDAARAWRRSALHSRRRRSPRGWTRSRATRRASPGQAEARRAASRSRTRTPRATPAALAPRRGAAPLGRGGRASATRPPAPPRARR